MKGAGFPSDLLLSVVQKRAIFKLAVDLAKADKQIHGNEVALLNSLQDLLKVSNDELDMIHYMSLQESMDALLSLDVLSRESIIRFLETMVGVDIDVDKREQLLYGSIKLALSGESCGWVNILSVSGVDTECSSEQIVYLEKSKCLPAREILDDKFENLLISKALSDVGLQLFYLPQIKQSIDIALLQSSMNYILPSSELAEGVDIRASLANTSCVAFFNAFCTSYRMSPGQVSYEAFLALKIQEGEILNDEGRLSRSIDFICIDVTSDIKKRITQFVTQIEAPSSTLAYDGYYRLLYDHLSSAISTVSSVVIDQRFDFYLKDIDNLKLKFESAPQAKTLFLLLLRYGTRGISQDCFEKAIKKVEDYKESVSSFDWNINSFSSELLREGTDEAKLIYNILIIYSCVSTKDPVESSFLNYISTILRQRSALKNYINTGFASVHNLHDKERYCITYDKQSRSYYLDTDTSLFLIADSDSGLTQINNSLLWKSLCI